MVAISDVRLRSGMLCLLNFSCPGNSVRLPVVGGPHWIGMAHLRGAVWDPGGVCKPHLVLSCDCLCLIALCRDILLYSRGQACLPALFLKDIGCWRTIDWELGFLGRVHAPGHEALSLCLDVGQIKSRWTVIMPRWVINVLFLQCVGVRGTTVSVCGSRDPGDWAVETSGWFHGAHTRARNHRRLPRWVRDRV